MIIMVRYLGRSGVKNIKVLEDYGDYKIIERKMFTGVPLYAVLHKRPKTVRQRKYKSVPYYAIFERITNIKRARTFVNARKSGKLKHV